MLNYFFHCLNIFSEENLSTSTQIFYLWVINCLYITSDKAVHVVIDSLREILGLIIDSQNILGEEGCFISNSPIQLRDAIFIENAVISGIPQIREV